MNSRAVTVGWLFLTIGVVVGIVWTAQARALAPENSNLQAMSLQDPKDLHRRPDLGCVFVRGVRAQDARVDRQACGVVVGARLRDRVAQPPSGELLRHHEPHVPMMRRVIGESMQVILLGVSHRTAPVEVRERLDFSSRDLGAAVEALALRPVRRPSRSCCRLATVRRFTSSATIRCRRARK